MKAIAACVLAGAAAILWPVAREIPRWQGDGTRSVLRPPLGEVPLDRITLGRTADILIVGDSNVLDNRLGIGTDGRHRPAFGATIERLSRHGWHVTVEGAGGDTAAMGEQRWASSRGTADLVILVYGDNDAAPRGWLSRKSATQLPVYASTMRRLIRRYHARGDQVLVLGPMAGGSPAIADRLAPYRQAARSAAIAEGAAFADPSAAFAGCADDEPLLNRDATHLNARGHACLGRWLYARISAARVPAVRRASAAD